MPNISRVRVAMTGFIGAPGVMTFYCLDPVVFLPALNTFLTSLTGILPNTVYLNTEPTGDTLDSVSGALTGAWTTTAPAQVRGTVSGGYSAPVGAVVHWLTGTIIDGHRLRGKTFIVPVTASNFGSDGQLTPAAVTLLRNAATALVGSTVANFVVWHRHRAARPADATHKAVTERAGGHSPVSGSAVPASPAVLRSRRD